MKKLVHEGRSGGVIEEREKAKHRGKKQYEETQ